MGTIVKCEINCEFYWRFDLKSEKTEIGRNERDGEANYLGAGIGERLEFVSRDQLFEKFSFLITALGLVRKPRVFFLPNEADMEAESSHVNGKYAIWFPHGIKTDDFIRRIITNRFLDHQASNKTDRPDADFFYFAHLKTEKRICQF